MSHLKTAPGCARAAWTGLALSWLLVVGARGAEPDPGREGSEFFETKIRPLLAERCYQCHSATSEKLKGGLHLDSRAGMLQGGDTRPAVVPGHPESSLMVEAVGYGNAELQMPPKQQLADGEVANLVAWIKMGAPWPQSLDANAGAKATGFDLGKRRHEHWAWKPIRREPTPEVKEVRWPVSSVDRFVLARLEAGGLKPAPPADRRTLLRRVYFDLIGLPPGPGEVEAFVQDSAPGAFEKVVDRLLASPRFGERWARHWLDLVRYSETLGHEFDYANFNAWRYRDYVIRAFNADVPYDQFVREHLAGDLLETPRRHPTEGFNESVIGTGFYWLGQRVHSPVDVRLEQAEVVDNQIDVATKTFLGLTVACARCHDHKFDAISTRDYYALFGVLGSSRYAQRSLDPPEKLAALVKALRGSKAELRPLVGAVWQGQASQVAAYLLAAREAGSGGPKSAPGEEVHTIASARQLDPARLERWVHALKDQKIARAEHPLFAWSRLAATTTEPSPGAFVERRQEVVNEWRRAPGGTAEPVSVETFADFSRPDFAGWSVEDEAFGSGPAPAGDFVVGDSNRPVMLLLPEPSANSAAVSRRLEGVLRSPTFSIARRHTHLLVAGSGSRVNLRVDNFTMIRDPIYGSLKRGLDHESLQWISFDLETWRGHRAYLEFDDLATPDPSEEEDRRYSDHAYLALSRVVFSDDPAPPPVGVAPAPLLNSDELAGVASPEQLAELYQRATLAAVRDWAEGRLAAPATRAELGWLDWLNQHSLLDGVVAEDPAARELTAVLREFQRLEEAIPGHARALGMIEGTGVDENVFVRGNHHTLGAVVPRRFLEALGGSEQTRFTHGSGRLELARQITDPANPFLARVMVNRVWHHLFGRGIVPTPDDFGALGQPPTNPELLDWLADWYRTEGGWSTRKLIRLLATSTTYQMSSCPSDPLAEEKDPDNGLLHRMPVRRLEGEAIRDAILAVSGRLDAAMFGPPVPLHLTEFMDGRGRPGRNGPVDGAGRRSLYQEVRRNFLPPMMRAFDFPVPFTTIGRRTVSNVPAQSLMLMNDPFVVAEARNCAKWLLGRRELSADDRIALMYQTILSRPPLPGERAEALAFLDRQGAAYGLEAAQRASDPATWADLCHVMMNLKEFVFLN